MSVVVGAGAVVVPLAVESEVVLAFAVNTAVAVSVDRGADEPDDANVPRLSDLLTCRLCSAAKSSAPNPNLEVTTSASRWLSPMLVSDADDVGLGDAALMMVVFEELCGLPSCTGHREKSFRLTSQYTSTSIRRKPSASKLEMHLAPATSSYFDCAKHAEVSAMPGTVTYNLVSTSGIAVRIDHLRN